jgi:surfactin synthase thioesterase subunit
MSSTHPENLVAHLNPARSEVWFPTRKAVPHARLRLFCFPFAGGGVSAFNGWRKDLPEDIDLRPVMLPGREYRLQEQAIDNLPRLVDAIVPAMTPLLDRPFVLLGYSMGARVATEVARRLQQMGRPTPVGLVVGAAQAPRARSCLNTDQMTDEQLLKLVLSYDGIPKEYLADRSLMQMVLPILRADFSIIETPGSAEAPRLNCPVAVWGGTQDSHVPVDTLRHWRDETTGECQTRLFPGGHFFLRGAKDLLLRALRDQLEQWFFKSERFAPAA